MTEVATVQKTSVDRMQVRIAHLDTLLSLAGEVIITSANLQDLERQVGTGGNVGQDGVHLIKASNEATRRISQDLHDLVMAIRLVEIGETFRVLRRPVRDLCRNLGREAEVEFEGADVLIDKALAERLVDPLLHLLRNAVDHGIEPPIERKGAGKTMGGRIVVRATDSEHFTEITVSDDGAGIDEATVRAAGRRELGDAAQRLPLRDLLCTPGLSTVAKVTATSGRGVGLDLVRNVVDEFDGEFSVETVAGKGSEFAMRIPKLRAVNIVDALTLRAGTGLFALPIDQVVANLGLPRDEIRTAFDRERHFLYQDQVVPLFDLQGVLGEVAEADLPALMPVIVLRSRAGLAAFVVSEFLGPQKLVNIPLDENMGHHVAIAGTAVFTGGTLGLTLDVDTLVAEVLGDRSALQTAKRTAAAISEAAWSVDPAAASPTPSQDTTTPASGDVDHTDREEAEDLRQELQSCLQRLQDTLLSLEGDPTSADHLNGAFRLLHAVKGHFTVLDAEGPATLAHHLETVLDYLRAERLNLTQDRMDQLLDGVTHLIAAADQLPGVPADPPSTLLAALHELTANETVAAEDGVALGDLIRQPFDLSPTMQLQVLSALKRGERTYETYLRFDPGRQPGFLAAYLLLRRIGKAGTVLATVPSVTDIEQGRCGREVKVLWSTSLTETDVDALHDRLAPQYSLHEHRTVPTTIFSLGG